jgi:hypothetical protein
MTEIDIEARKEEYFNNLPQNQKEESEVFGKDFGLTKDGDLVFFYPNAIKVHKAGKDKKTYWLRNNKDDAICQIFGSNRIDKTKPVYIFEGEPDVIVVRGLYNAISFSHGAGMIPQDVSILKNVPQIIVIGDNDDAGEMHNQKVAHHFYLMGIEVKIAKWDESLPKGYAKKIEFVLVKETPKEISYLTEDEFNGIMQLDVIDVHFRKAFLFYYMTGCRKAEPFKAELSGNWLTIKSADAKAHRTRDVELNQILKGIATEMKDRYHMLMDEYGQNPRNIIMNYGK